MYSHQSFSPVCRSSLLIGSFAVKVFNFSVIPLVSSWDYFLWYWYPFRKFSAVPVLYFSLVVSVLLLILKFFIHSLLNSLLWRMGGVDLVSFFYIWISSFPKAFVKKAVFQYMFLTLLPKFARSYLGLIWNLYSILV